MVKKRVQKVKKRRSAAAAEVAKAGVTEEHGDDGEVGPAPPDHIKRKLARQSQFMQKIVDNQRKILSAKKPGLKKKGKRKQLSGALADLSSLSGALLDAASSDAAKAEQKAKPKGLGVGGAKKRMRINDREAVRLEQVLGHPQFIADPIAAITAHLEATMPPKPPPPKAPQAAKSGPGSGKRRRERAAERQRQMQID
mmetsp:Transcript_20281/g.61108  ORF Transcript_20281/g.61108 Transcript_20281/m.61108 type:complete len:197 (-) Transcript_20281:201-791(-)|eukprot:CAMPEP_0206142912 /NCGR_PEP_ID=MMETSP1473-20131121/18616_1 /ASSEMBLY_ACC=CAM_ASM_001109 /TAXON_ID=1461547 /ORGANISM="Stichococcus sp, Strain RCC1054" /LENGTH=196 /DNA_ID=CAMNT_0053538081 /DNA_START=116 /DNA_END=706 /DNA_ORIENTATION=-